MAYPRNTSAAVHYSEATSKEIHALADCLSICRACAKKCIENGNGRLALLCSDCADICDLAIKFRSSDSSYCQQVWDLCTHICRQCANECSRETEAHYQECAEACRHCAEVCASHPNYR